MQRVSVPVGSHVMAADVHLLGDGRPPVVFLHGVMTSIDLARFVFADAESESWIAVALPGHAPGRLTAGTAIDDRLMADLIEKTLERLVGDRRVIAVGWSAGGCAALTLAVHHPHRVLAVATLAGFVDGREISGPVAWLMWLARRPVGRWAVVAGLRLAAAWPWLHRAMTNALAAPGHRVPRDIAAAMHTAFRRHDARSLADVLAAVPALRLAADVATIDVPVWVVGGEADATIPTTETSRLAGLMPTATLTLYPAAGHLFFSEWPQLPADCAAWRTAVERP